MKTCPNQNQYSYETAAGARDIYSQAVQVFVSSSSVCNLASPGHCYGPAIVMTVTKINRHCLTPVPNYQSKQSSSTSNRLQTGLQTVSCKVIKCWTFVGTATVVDIRIDSEVTAGFQQIDPCIRIFRQHKKKFLLTMLTLHLPVSQSYNIDSHSSL